jgi:hypothetical protein
VLGSIETPVGRFGLTVYTKAPLPPDPCTGMIVELIFWFSVKETLGCITVASNGGGASMVRLNCLLVVLLLASVIVMIKLLAVNVTVGVPEINPVVESKVRPLGKEGETL